MPWNVWDGAGNMQKIRYVMPVTDWESATEIMNVMISAISPWKIRNAYMNR